MLQIYISEGPTIRTINQFIDHIHGNKIKHVVRVCEPKYDGMMIQQASINFYDWPFADGMNPTPDIIVKWLELIKHNEPILIHCVAGLGRAPLMVAIALIEYSMDSLDAVEFIRKKRQGCLNSKQIEFLMKYKPQRRRGFFARLCGKKNYSP
jgi:protein tyrosine phosphatase type 4A